MTQPISDSLAYLRKAESTTFRGYRALEIVRAWHNDTHQGGFETCDQQPCHAINRPPA
jgi:hypothetical protein